LERKGASAACYAMQCRASACCIDRIGRYGRVRSRVGGFRYAESVQGGESEELRDVLRGDFASLRVLVSLVEINELVLQPSRKKGGRRLV